MADFDSTRAGKLDKPDADTLLKEARKQWDRAYERERSNIAAAYEDLEFLSGSQWPEKVLKERNDEGRPVLTINRLPQFVHQVTGDIRQMRPSIKVVPVDDQADEQVADIKAGLIRYIENRSDAAGIYFQAADQQVGAGIGHWRVMTEYAEDSTFLQEIRIAGVDDGISVLWDPDCKYLTREDAKFCFVPVDYSTEGFKDVFPKASQSDWSTLAEWSSLAHWYTDSHVRVAEYWVKKPDKRILALTPTGQTLDLTDESEEDRQVAVKMGARLEERDSYKICRYLITAAEILEGPEEWAGRYIPIVPVIGEEVRIGRKIVRNGIVRHAKDPQRMYNYGRSTQTEVFSLQPKAPFMVTETNVAKYQDVWDSANKKNWPYLPFEPDTKNSGQAPQRIAPPVASQGVNEAVGLANEDMKAVIGIYDASLGNRSNETSGVAIKARQQEGDVGTYTYIDNFARAVRHTGKILIDLIPHVYDTERTIRIMGEDGKIDMLKINQTQQGVGPNGEFVNQVLNDVSVGSYDVVCEVGPSYSTRRQEAKEGMIELLKATPDIAPLIMDKVVKAQDWPMADDIAKRIRANLPPAILQAEDMEKQGASPEQIQQVLQQGQQKPPDPALVKVQQDGQLRAQEQQFQQAKAAADGDQAMRKMEMEAVLKREEMAQNAQLERERMNLDAQTKIEIAQINAGVGQHKTIVQAGTDHMATQTDAAIQMHKIDTAAESARYTADSRGPAGSPPQ